MGVLTLVSPARGAHRRPRPAVIPAGAAVRSPRAQLAMTAAAALALAADQVTKALVLAGRIAGNAGWAAVQLARNPGASGGLAAGYPVLVTATAAAITVVAVALALRTRGAFTALSLSVVVGGALGNLADRLLRAPGLGRGEVVDWIHFAGHGGSMDVADIAINLGAAGALIAVLLTRQPAGGGRPAGRGR